MKIIFCDNTLWGLLNFRTGVINHFLALGHSVVIIAPNDNMCNIDNIPHGVKFIPIKLERTSKNPLNDLKYYKTLKNIYKIEKPDFIFHFTIKPNIYGSFAAKTLGIKSAAMIAGLGYVYTQGGISNLIARAMYKKAMQFPERILVLNQANFDTLVKNNVVKKNKLILLDGGEGINLTKFTAQAMQKNEKPIFLMICRLLYEKGYTEYISAARALKDRAEFRIMGPIDSHPSAVKRETIENDVKHGIIKYIEFSSNVAQEITKADCVVLPSFYGEGLSRVLMEGLAIGRAIITTDIAGCKETVIEGVNGYLCKPKNTKSLILAMEKFIINPNKHAMATESRKLAEKIFDEKIVHQTYDKIIRLANLTNEQQQHPK